MNCLLLFHPLGDSSDDNDDFFSNIIAEFLELLLNRDSGFNPFDNIQHISQKKMMMKIKLKKVLELM